MTPTPSTPLQPETKQVMNNEEIEVLKQCRQVIHDGDMVSKAARDAIWRKGYIARAEGFQVVTAKGIKKLIALKIVSY